MKYLVLWCSLNCLFFINTVYSTVTIQPNYSHKEQKAVTFTVKKTFELSCNVTVNPDSEKVSVEWLKGSEPVTEISGLKNRITISSKSNTHILTIKEPEYSDAGNYTCRAEAGIESAEEHIIVASNIAVQIKPDDINVVEEEKLRIVCQVLGNPVPDISWLIDTLQYNDTLTSNSSDGRIIIAEHKDESGKAVPNALLIIEKATKEDRGSYNCTARSKYGEEEYNAKAYVRVKDKYAALWPFLGICVEVIVLCAVIIIYEKKRNKSELEESDTDQSPDQKNTPDHGKEANLRHRQ